MTNMRNSLFQPAPGQQQNHTSHKDQEDSGECRGQGSGWLLTVVNTGLILTEHLLRARPLGRLAMELTNNAQNRQCVSQPGNGTSKKGMSEVRQQQSQDL